MPQARGPRDLTLEQAVHLLHLITLVTAQQVLPQLLIEWEVGAPQGVVALVLG